MQKQLIWDLDETFIGSEAIYQGLRDLCSGFSIPYDKESVREYPSGTLCRFAEQRWQKRELDAGVLNQVRALFS